MSKKDPAFLFYSQDFFLGTRTMTPIKRACYVDLLVYQHQYGIIPKDLEAPLMFCTGIDEATLKAVLKAKFKETESGWINEKLSMVVQERSEYKSKKSISGAIGQFYKKISQQFKPDKLLKIKQLIRSKYSNEELYSIIKDKSKSKAMLKAMLKHIENENENEIEIENKDEIRNENNLNFSKNLKSENSNSIRLDIFSIAYTELLKKYDKDFHYSPSIHNQDYADIFDKVKQILIGRNSEITIKAMIDLIDVMICNSGWWTKNRKVLSPKTFNERFDDIRNATKAPDDSKEAKEKKRLSDIEKLKYQVANE